MVWRDEKKLYFIINETFIRIIYTYIFVEYNKWDATKRKFIVEHLLKKKLGWEKNASAAKRK